MDNTNDAAAVTWDKAKIMKALRQLAESRPRMHPADYADKSQWSRDRHNVYVDLLHARRLADAVDRCTGLTGARLAEYIERNRTIRLTHEGETVKAEIVKGMAQKEYSIEFRWRICRVLAHALYSYRRDHAMPLEATLAGLAIPREAKESPHAYFRYLFRREFGRHLASRYFS